MGMINRLASLWQALSGVPMHRRSILAGRRIGADDGLLCWRRRHGRLKTFQLCSPAPTSIATALAYVPARVYRWEGDNRLEVHRRTHSRA